MTDTPPADLGEIIVIGIKAVASGVPGGGGGGGGDPGGIEENTDTGGQSPGGTGYTEEQARAENERQKECAAQRFENKLNEQAQKDSKEFFSFTWVRDGQNVTHEIRGGADVRVTVADRNAARAEFGISWPSIVGFNHNHPSNEYCASGGLQGQQELTENAYPSDNDWAWAESVVSNFSVPPETFSLFITDCEGITRSFAFGERAVFKAARNAQVQPPAPIAPTNCPEE